MKRPNVSGEKVWLGTVIIIMIILYYMFVNDFFLQRIKTYYTDLTDCYFLLHWLLLKTEIADDKDGLLQSTPVTRETAKNGSSDVFKFDQQSLRFFFHNMYSFKSIS